MTPRSKATHLEVSVRNFRELCDAHGHVVAFSLQSALLTELRGTKGCVAAREVPRGHYDMCCAVEVEFADDARTADILATLEGRTFDLRGAMVGPIRLEARRPCSV